MPDYELGRAHGEIEISYDGSGADKAARDLDKVAASSSKADESLSKTSKTLGDTDRQLGQSSSSAEGYSARLREVESASRDVDSAEKHLKATLLDSKASINDIESAYDRLKAARDRHTKSVDAERAAHKALSGEMSIGQKVIEGLGSIIPKLSTHFEELGKAQGSATDKASGLASALSTAAKAAMALGQPEVAAGLAGVSKIASTAQDAGTAVGGFVQQIAGLELAVGKISGISLGVGSLAGLAGLGGGAGLQGLTEVAGSIEQLSGLLGLLPALASGAGVVVGTLGVAFHGVDSALKDMFANDPKKFLQDIANMGPAAAQSMLQIAQFRDQFKAGAGAVQDSFFSKIAADIGPLIQTWLPALVSAGSQVAGVLGGIADQFAKLLQQPQVMAAFTTFINDVSAGLQAIAPAMAPLLDIFTKLTTTGGSFFQQLGADLVQFSQFFDNIVSQAQASGGLQAWIQTGIDAFGHLVNIAYEFGSAFLNIMTVADQFGGGGLLGWLEQLTIELNNWTQSAAGQKALTDFFTLLRQATDAFTPMLEPVLNGLVALGKGIVQLGIATAPGWQTFFNDFATAMQTLGPMLATMGPALNQFLTNMGVALINLVNQVGPQLPALFSVMSNAFSALLPQIGPLVNIFMQFVDEVGPQLPQLFQNITALLQATLPYWPIVTGLVRDFVSVVSWFIGAGAKVIDWFTNLAKSINDGLTNLPQTLGHIGDTIENFFKDLPQKALEWGKSIIKGLIDGLIDVGGLGNLGGAAKTVVDTIAGWFQHSPAKQGPFSGDGYTMVRGQKMVEDMAAGMVSAQGAVTAAARSTAVAASNALGTGATAGGGGGAAGAPAAGGADAVGGALLPPNIANANTSVLDAYLKHQFPDNDGLKGLAKDLGNILKVGQSGFNFLSNNVMQPLFQALGLLPGSKDPTWKKLTPEQIAAQQESDLQKKALEDNKKQGPTWGDVLGQGAPGAGTPGGAAVPLGLSASSTPQQIQQGIIAAGRARGLNDAAIQTALAIAADESGFNPNAPGGGLYQQQNSSWGTPAQIADPNHAINAFYDAYAKNLTSTPTDPLLAAVLTQNPQLGSGAKGSAYWNAVTSKLGEAGQILTQQGPAVKNGPTWQQLTGGAPAAAGGGYTSDAALLAQIPGQGRQYVSEPGVGDLSKGIGDCTSAIEDLVNLIDSRPTAGRSLSTSNADQWLTERGFLPGTGGPGDFRVGFNVEHMQATLPGGTNFSWGSQAAAESGGVAPNSGAAFGDQHYFRPVAVSGAAGGATAVATQIVDQNGNPIALVPPSTSATEVRDQNGNILATVPPGTTPGTSPGVGGPLSAGNLLLPSGKTLDQLTNNTAKTASVNDQLLQAYLQGNPALAQQINAAKTPGADDQTVLGGLKAITSTIDTLKQQDAVGNKNTIEALQSTQNQIAQGAGFTQGQSALQTAQSIGSGISGAISGAFQVAQSYLDALTATQDITDRLVYGIRNTEDINKIIDDVQKYITFAANIFSEAGNIVSTVGSFTGGSDFGGTSAAGSALSLIASALQGVNAAIDFGQEIYHIAGTYVGRFLSFLTGGLTGSPLMGDVRFLLNKNTGQLISYSEDNPQLKNTLTVPKFLNQTYDYGSGSNPNPQVNTQYNIYAGPGQSPGEMLNEVNWMVNTAGTTGALAPANF